MKVTASELLRRAQLRSDFGAVARAHPIDSTVEVRRQTAVEQFVKSATQAADLGHRLLLVGPPGHGKSWLCQQMLKSLSGEDWLVAEHYCYLGDTNPQKLPRVRAESVFGSLLGRIAEHDATLVSSQRPLLAADATALEKAVLSACRNAPSRRIALIVDGIDHVTRVLRGGGDVDPSLALAEELASLSLPAGSTLIVLSQPGNHLGPLDGAETTTLEIPGLTDAELCKLAARLGLPVESTSRPRASTDGFPRRDETQELLSVLSHRSSGNALYATYLCREVQRREPGTSPAETLRRLPAFDGSLHAYYEHIHSSLGTKGAWVADVIAFLEFPVSRTELKNIRPDMAHRVDSALEALAPVLLNNAIDGGFRVYHESFSRFLRRPVEADANARTALFGRLLAWLEDVGLFRDSRAFHHLLPMLYEAQEDDRVLALTDREFVLNAVASAFPTSAIVENLSTAMASAARRADWPAVVRYVELSRSAETYRDERFESAMVGFIDVAAGLLGAATVARRLLHNGRTVMSARTGLQVCAALDALGAVVPWHEYMTALEREQSMNTARGVETSGTDIRVAWLRGRLRLVAERQLADESPGNREAAYQANRGVSATLYEPLRWRTLAQAVDNGSLSSVEVVDALIDTLGLPGATRLIEELERPGAACLALSEAVAAGRASASSGDSMYWAEQAASLGVPAGNARRLVKLGVDIARHAPGTVSEARERLQELTQQVQESSVQSRPERVAEWIDACTVAITNDPIGAYRY